MVRKGVFHTAHVLSGFVPLAGNQHHIAFFSRSNRFRNGAGTFRLDVCMGWVAQPGDHLGQNGVRVFTAWVVTGQAHMDCACFRTGRHQWTFGGIAISAATHDAVQSATAQVNNRAQRRQDLVKRIRRVGIVHQYQRQVCSARYPG